MKKLVAMLLCSICFLSFTLVSFGEEISSERNDIELGNTRINRSKRSADYLASTDCKINFYYKNGKLVVSGHTEAYDDVDNVSIVIYVQKYDEKSRRWKNIYTISENERNSDSIRCSESYTVPSGKYRAQSYHELKEGSSKETERNTTKTIRVN
ncbi:DUF6147 family protein [Tepidibacter aestuarii]|uniref:DUF6147 family protein n=1 Tax=Tepidibacter aestuarii TaxID=2925782 RepID=UPI0020BEFCC7|nr:DUF6147 family protein [Tepidibacter aestuarii]CAH2215082.1 conserved exported protein of unknown function [Tepidibacter aestuarii]